jgi:hypothetical protein
VRRWVEKAHYKGQLRSKRHEILEQYKVPICQELGLARRSATLISRELNKKGYQCPCATLGQFEGGRRTATGEHEVLPLGRWMLKLLLGKVTWPNLMQEFAEALRQDEAEALIKQIREGRLRARIRGLAVLAHLRGVPIRQIARFLMVSRSTVRQFLRRYRESGVKGLFSVRVNRRRKHEQSE